MIIIVPLLKTLGQHGEARPGEARHGTVGHGTVGHGEARILKRQNGRRK